MKNVSKKAKRRLKILAFSIFAVIGLLVSSVYKDWEEILDNQKLANNLSEEYEVLLNEEQSLNSEVTKFLDPDYIARYAREKYLYSLPGELIIKKSTK